MRNGLVVALLAVCVLIGVGLGYVPGGSSMPTLRRSEASWPTAAPAPPSATLSPTATRTARPTPLPPTPSRTLSPTPSPTSSPTPAPWLMASPTPQPPQPGAHGISAQLRLHEERADYAVGEAVFFDSDVRNHTDADLVLGIAGLRVDGGIPFVTTGSAVALGAQSQLSIQHQVTFAAPGTYTATLAICFSATSACPAAGADWEEFLPPVVVQVR